MPNQGIPGKNEIDQKAETHLNSAFL